MLGQHFQMHFVGSLRMGFTWRWCPVSLSSPVSSAVEFDASSLTIEHEASTCSILSSSSVDCFCLASAPCFFCMWWHWDVHIYPLAKVDAFSGNCPPLAHIPMSIYNAKELEKKAPWASFFTSLWWRSLINHKEMDNYNEIVATIITGIAIRSLLLYLGMSFVSSFDSSSCSPWASVLSFSHWALSHSGLQSLLLAVHEKLHQEATTCACQTFSVTMACDCLANILNVIVKLAEAAGQMTK